MRSVGWIVLLCLLSGCSKISKQVTAFTPERNAEYLQAQVSPPLKLPQGYSLGDEANNFYPIPQGPRLSADSTPPSIVPPTLALTMAEDNHDENK